MAGRKKKPTELKIIQGTFRKDRANLREPKVKGVLSAEPPAHLTDEQKEIWRYALERAPYGLLKPLDLSVMEIWVVAYSLYKDAAIKVRESGQVVRSPSGYPIVNPYLGNLNKQSVIMLKAASEMGFTPSSRSRIVIGDEITIDDPWAEFAT